MLRLDGRPAAVVLGFIVGDTYQCFQESSGLDFEAHRPARCLLSHCIEDCIRERVERFDSLAGEHSYNTEYFSGRKAVGRVTIGRAIPEFWMPLGRDLRVRAWKARAKNLLAGMRRPGTSWCSAPGMSATVRALHLRC
jgi:hypothetical protein